MSYSGTYLILSLNGSPGFRGCALWWRPNNAGYTERIELAGRYSAEQVLKHRSYYDNRKLTMAVPESVAMANSESIRLAEYGGRKRWERLVSGEGE